MKTPLEAFAGSPLYVYPNPFLSDVTPTDVMAMNQNVPSYHIRPWDALHLTAMQKVGCLQLWNEDGDYDDVPGVVRYSLEGSSAQRSA